MTTRSQGPRASAPARPAAKGWQAMTGSGWSKKLPAGAHRPAVDHHRAACRTCRSSSACHCARSVAGASTRSRPCPSASELGDHHARLDGLAQPDLVGEHAAAAGQRLEREGRGLDLVRIEVDPGLGERRGEPLGGAGRSAAPAPRRAAAGGSASAARRREGSIGCAVRSCADGNGIVRPGSRPVKGPHASVAPHRGGEPGRRLRDATARRTGLHRGGAQAHRRAGGRTRHAGRGARLPGPAPRRPAIRTRALLALARVQDLGTAPPVAEALTDPVPSVRAMAAFAAGELGLAWQPVPDDVRAQLTQALLRAEEKETDAAAHLAELDALGRVRTEAALERLVSRLDSACRGGPHPRWTPSHHPRGHDLGPVRRGHPVGGGAGRRGAGQGPRPGAGPGSPGSAGLLVSRAHPVGRRLRAGTDEAARGPSGAGPGADRRHRRGARHCRQGTGRGGGGRGRAGAAPPGPGRRRTGGGRGGAGAGQARREVHPRALPGHRCARATSRGG